MPYASTYGKKVYPFQSDELPPEEQAGVPMLTNIPKSAETAAGRGQDVYFLSDRPETEQFLAERTPERPYKRVLRDVHAKPFVDEDQLLDAMEKGKRFLGFNPMEPPNPGKVAQAAYDEYYNRATPEQLRTWSDPVLKLHKAEATKVRDKAYKEAMQQVEEASKFLVRHGTEAAKRRPEPAKKALSPVDLQTSYPELTPEEAGTAAQAWNTGKTDIYNKIVRGKKITSKGKETREVKRGGEIITEERDLATGEWKEIARAPREIKTPNFKEEKLKEIWGNLDDQSKLKVLNALPPEKELTDKNILDVYGNIFTNAETKKALQPIVQEITKAAAEKKKGPISGVSTRILPQGSKQIGTYNGKPVYQTPDGKRVVMQ